MTQVGPIVDTVILIDHHLGGQLLQFFRKSAPLFFLR